MYMLQILGDRSSRMTVEQLEIYEKKGTTLKVKVLSFMKSWIKQNWQRMAKKDPNLLLNIKDLQKQWGVMNVCDKAEVDRTCQSFWKLIQPGASDDFETNRELKAQDFFMKRFNYKY
jgi:hypothetical protein